MQSINIRIEKWMKGCILTFPKKVDLRITKNYGRITLIVIAAMVYNGLLLNCIRSGIEKILWKKSEQLSKKRSHHNFIDPYYQSNHRNISGKESRGSTNVCRFLQGIQFYAQREDEANTTYRWSPQRNCFCYNNALQKHESNCSLTRWKHQLLRHCL